MQGDGSALSSSLYSVSAARCLIHSRRRGSDAGFLARPSNSTASFTAVVPPPVWPRMCCTLFRDRGVADSESLCRISRQLSEPRIRENRKCPIGAHMGEHRTDAPCGGVPSGHRWTLAFPAIEIWVGR